MKILFFSSYFYPHISGLTIYPLRILKHLGGKNEVTVLTFSNKKQLTISHLAIRHVPYLFKLSKGFYSPLAKFYFLKYILKNDIVILNLPSGESLWLAILAKLLSKKLISIFHCEVTLPLSPINQLIEVILKTITNIQLSLSDQIITNTKDYFDSLNLTKKFGKKTSYIFPPIELNKVSSKELKHFLSLKKDKIWIGFLGRISSEKGIEYLIKAVRNIVIPAFTLSEIEGKAGIYQIELIFAGQAKAVYEEKYRFFINQQLTITNIKYRFFNKLKDDQISAFYKSLDIFVLPSTNSTESFGMTQCEAMIMGTPVISSNLPGVRIPLKLTKMGILVKPKNSLEIKNAILKILKNKKTYSNILLVNKAKKIFDPKKTYIFFEKILNL